MQQLSAVYAALAAFVGALGALAIYHAAVVRPALARARQLLAVHDELIAGGAGGAAGRLASLERADEALHAGVDGLAQRVAGLETLAGTDVSHCGFVRYDAFDDSDSEAGLSYALALLNRAGDGVVLTSIYSRTDTRTYGKPVTAFKPTVQASAEELQAIERARNGAK